MIIANKFRVKQASFFAALVSKQISNKISDQWLQDDINNAVTEFQKMLSSLMSSVRGEFSGLKDRMDERFKGFMHRSNEIFYDLRTSLGNMFEGLRRSTSSH